MTSPALPNFFLAGHPKCGTTTLYEHLSAHPDVFMPRVKEPAYFSHQEEYQRGLDHYHNMHYRGAQNFQAVGEATPWYAPVPAALMRIRSDLPTSSHRFVLLLRSPVDRAYSMFWDQVRVGRETRRFDIAVEEELAMIGHHEPPPEDQRQCARRYLWTSRYEKHVELMDDLFGPAATLILIQDDLEYPYTRGLLLRDLSAFLGVDAGGFQRDGRRSNVAKSHRSPTLAKALSAPGPAAELLRRLARVTLPITFRRDLRDRVDRINQRPTPYPPLAAADRARLEELFSSTVDFVERRLDRKLPAWKTSRDLTQ